MTEVKSGFGALERAIEKHFAETKAFMIKAIVAWTMLDLFGKAIIMFVVFKFVRH